MPENVQQSSEIPIFPDVIFMLMMLVTTSITWAPLLSLSAPVLAARVGLRLDV